MKNHGGKSMRQNITALLLLSAAAAWAGCEPPPRVEMEASHRVADVDPALLEGISWRSIGPAMFAGRISDVAGIPGEPDLLYVGASSSGLFRSTNGGITFESVFDEGNTLSIGAIAVQPDDPEVIWVGTGEGAVRNSISYGDGIYRTTDGGRSWSHMGLPESERFSRIVIHPGNPDIVYAAAMGHAFGPNQERGVFRTRDGGTTWERVLFTNETSGASDIAIDPADPDIVYAGMHDYFRQPWHFRSGGPGSGLFRSSDGGATWVKLTDPALSNGLPGAALIGRVGVSVHQADPRVVYALIESQEPGELWRSDDRGVTWQMVSADRRINNRPFYYTQVRADPVDPERVYTLAGSFSVSTDGGRSFGGTGGSMFGDHHALWIDPQDPGRLLSGTDGGFWISNDRGSNWDFVNNMP
ncbi:MAG: glycosyl hydrolase, partial [Gemmatimonadota bacterium]